MADKSFGPPHYFMDFSDKRWVCEKCGAMVHDKMLEQHDLFHARLNGAEREPKEDYNEG